MTSITPSAENPLLCWSVVIFWERRPRRACFPISGLSPGFMDAPQVGILVRNGGRLSGHGSDPDREQGFPKIFKVYAAYEQAGGELAREGGSDTGRNVGPTRKSSRSHSLVS